MFRIFAVPVSVQTVHGRCLARFGLEPERAGDPWWVIYRDADGRWLTAMVAHAAIA